MKNLKHIIYLAPIFFWMIIIGIKLIRVIPLYSGEELHDQLYIIGLTSGLDIITFLVFYFFFIPQLLQRKNIIINSIGVFIYWVSYGVIWSWIYHITNMSQGIEESIAIYKASFGHTLLNTLYALFIRLSADWFVKFQKQKDLEKQNLMTELALLRSQVNPHFLFNTLNNIHSFSLTEPEKSSFAIIKLSEMMRYMLYEANGEKVALEKEVNYVQNLIELHKLRFKDDQFVKLEIIGELGTKQIPPMIFLPFIENAFKHGKQNVKDAIQIHLKVEESQMIFNCRNFIKSKSDTEKTQLGGVGLKNIKRRLQLLFPEQHQLSITSDDILYSVELIISGYAY